MRNKNDFYPTPVALTRELIKRIPITGLSTIVEPCAGLGHMSRELGRHSNYVYTNDIDTRWSLEVDTIADASVTGGWKTILEGLDRPEWVITNPPYNQASKIIPLAFDNCTRGIAMLLRLSYLQPARGRDKWLQTHSMNLSNLIVFGMPRPSFLPNGKQDMVTTAWMVWRKEWRDGCSIQFVTNWREQVSE